MRLHDLDEGRGADRLEFGPADDAGRRNLSSINVVYPNFYRSPMNRTRSFPLSLQKETMAKNLPYAAINMMDRMVGKTGSRTSSGSDLVDDMVAHCTDADPHIHEQNMAKARGRDDRLPGG